MTSSVHEAARLSKPRESVPDVEDVYGRVSAVSLTFALQGLYRQDLLTGDYSTF